MNAASLRSFRGEAFSVDKRPNGRYNGGSKPKGREPA